MVNATTEVLSYLFCFLIEFPNEKKPCTVILKDKVCLNCPIKGRFQTGGHSNDINSVGHKVCLFIWILIVIVGVVGVVLNTWIIIILRKQQSTKAFQILLVILAIFDLLCCATSAISTGGMISHLQNWRRVEVILKLTSLAYILTVFGRSGSTYFKILIVAERYMFISNPEKASVMLSNFRTRVLAAATVIFAIFINLPRFLSVDTVKNCYTQHSEDLKFINQLDWISQSSQLGKQPWFDMLRRGFLIFDFVMPFPVLIIFGVLIYIEIKKITCKKRELQVTRKKDIREVQMFLPVILLLFLCSVLPIAHYSATYFTEIAYREHVFASVLFFALNSAINLPIYCWKGTIFRKESTTMLQKIIHRRTSNIDN